MEIWPNLEKNATQIMIFLAHLMSAENNSNWYLQTSETGPESEVGTSGGRLDRGGLQM